VANHLISNGGIGHFYHFKHCTFECSDISFRQIDSELSGKCVTCHPAPNYEECSHSSQGRGLHMTSSPATIYYYIKNNVNHNNLANYEDLVLQSLPSVFAYQEGHLGWYRSNSLDSLERYHFASDRNLP
jgi:hypothetical protein